jgi:bacillithiol system protein YtxJ
MINWVLLDDNSKLLKAIEESFTKDVVIFKHSTTCSISLMAKRRLEEDWDDLENVIPYYLDLKTFRSISDEVAERFSVHHESPQILLIRQGECIYDASHFDITIAELKETLVFHA